MALSAEQFRPSQSQGNHKKHLMKKYFLWRRSVRDLELNQLCRLTQKKPKELKKEEPRKIDDDAINILRGRYAKGEITEEEYEKMKKKLEY